MTTMSQIGAVPARMTTASSACRPPPLARHPVGPHAAEQEERDERQGVRGQHDADVGGRADLRHVQRERHGDDAVAERAGRLAVEQQPEVAMGEQRAHGRRA
jgi:hypothetical protein